MINLHIPANYGNFQWISWTEKWLLRGIICGTPPMAINGGSMNHGMRGFWEVLNIEAKGCLGRKK